MKARATVRLNISSEKQLHVIMQALKPETETSSTKRSQVHMTTEDETLILHFKARDTPALRASMNAYLRLISVAMNLKKFSEQ